MLLNKSFNKSSLLAAAKCSGLLINNGSKVGVAHSLLIKRSLSSSPSSLIITSNLFNNSKECFSSQIRSYTSSADNTTTDKATSTGSASTSAGKPDRNKIIAKYLVKDVSPSHKDFTDNGYEVVFYSKREAIFKNLKLLFGGQIALTSVVPIGFLLKGSDIKYTMFGMMLVAWSTSFYFIGKMMMSNFVIRLYYKKGENFVYVVQYAPAARVLKIPIGDIKPSNFNPDGTPYMLLESDQLFFFERDGMLKNRESLEYILSGEEYDFKTKSREEAEYNEHIANSLDNAQKIEATNKSLDEQLKSLEQELETLKNDKPKQ